MTMIKEQCFSHSLNCLRDILAYQRGLIIIKSGLDLRLKVSIKQVYHLMCYLSIGNIGDIVFSSTGQRPI